MMVTLGGGIDSLSGTELSGSGDEGVWMDSTCSEIGGNSPEGRPDPSSAFLCGGSCSKGPVSWRGIRFGFPGGRSKSQGRGTRAAGMILCTRSSSVVN